jgi:hypothetical protein
MDVIFVLMVSAQSCVVLKSIQKIHRTLNIEISGSQGGEYGLDDAGCEQALVNRLSGSERLLLYNLLVDSLGCLYLWDEA